MAEHTVQVLDRLYDIEFTPPILRESEAGLSTRCARHGRE
jgi:hypothetical protein